MSKPTLDRRMSVPPQTGKAPFQQQQQQQQKQQQQQTRRGTIGSSSLSSSLSSSRKPKRFSVAVIGGIVMILMLTYVGILFSMASMHHPGKSAVAESGKVRRSLESNTQPKGQTGGNNNGNRRHAAAAAAQRKKRKNNKTNNNQNSKRNKRKTAAETSKTKIAKKTRRPMRRRPHFRAEQYGKGVNPHTIKPNNDEEQDSNLQNSAEVIVVHPSQVLKTFLEPVDFGSWNVKPLPVRSTATAHQLKEISYPKLNSCSRLQEQWPTDDFPDADPFLPWIHDVFPTDDGKFIQFVAQNKRRCRTGTTGEEIKILENMAPQVALFQHVPVKRIQTISDQRGTSSRYRLASHEEADPDGLATRFICRFKPIMKETLSVFNVDYDYAAYRKGHRQTFSEEGYDNKSIHTSQLIFQCPVPPELVDIVKSGSSVKDDWATLFVDVIPIRTPPRYGPPNQFFPPWYKNLQVSAFHQSHFDAHVEWGDNHILPNIEDAGRWENIPICKPSIQTYEPQLSTELTALSKTDDDNDNNKRKLNGDKKHGLVACVWASAGYTTRGHRFAVNDGQRRLLEWIHFNQLVGFDHFYIYDNSGAFSSDVSLKPITDMFPDLITRIVWPAKVCNNNPNNVDSVGERSSQYAAESSCRLRFGPHVEWMASFDLDEYIVPVGKYKSLLPLLRKLNNEGRKIISFGSWRAWPRRDLIDKPIPITDSQQCWSIDSCFDLTVPLNHTILQTYNCDRHKGRKKQTMPAEKQIYQPDYVKQHFIHYSTVTELTLWNTSEWTRRMNGHPWKPHLAADPFSRFSDELTEATMLHTKAVARQDTAGWLYVCHKDYVGQQYCRLGNPWPPGAEEANITADPNGWKYNCYINDKIEQYWVPRLEQALRKGHSE